MSWIARFEGVASPRQVISYNFPISALFPITSDGEILSHMNHLATPALGKSFAVEIQASEVFWLVPHCEMSGMWNHGEAGALSDFRKKMDHRRLGASRRQIMAPK